MNEGKYDSIYLTGLEDKREKIEELSAKTLFSVDDICRFIVLFNTSSLEKLKSGLNHNENNTHN